MEELEQVKQELAKQQQEVAKLTQQIQGLAAERNSFRQKSDAWEKLAGELQEGSVELDANGLPVAWATAPSRSPSAAGGPHPFADVLADPSAADTWLQAQLKATLGSQGFVTSKQMQDLLKQAVSQAYQAARGDSMFWRYHDSLIGRESAGADGKPLKPYADLGKKDSDLSKAVARILKEKGWGEPMSEQAESFATDWRYPVDGKALEWAADLALGELKKSAQAGQAAAASGQAAQAAAALSQTPPGGAPGAQPKVKELIGQGAEESEVLAALDQTVGAK